MEKFILALDQGTTGTTVSIVGHDGRIRASVNKEHPQIYPRVGWVEHDPEAIWQSVIWGVGQALSKAKINGEQVSAIGITNQRETVVMWDRTTGGAVYNAIVWQCRRTTEFCERLKKSSKNVKLIAKKTGLVVDPYFSASKINWLLNNVKGLRARAKGKGGDLCIGTIDTFLLWRMTSGKSYKTDVSNASRTQLMDIESLAWSPELCGLFDVPEPMLPEICASNSHFGETQNFPGLPDGVPITGIAGDQQAALFGQTCFEVGSSKCTFGTGSFLLMNTGNRRLSSKSGLLTTIAWQLKDEKKPNYALEGGAFICGAAVQWLRDQMQFISSSAEVETLAKTVESTDGVFVVPAFVGLGAPYWRPDARAAIVGMTRGTGRGHIARATLEAMALQNVDILRAMEADLGKKMGKVRVDGGAVQNELLMQMQADFLGVSVERPQATESTVLGAAFLAGLGIGYWADLSELKKVWKLEKSFAPVMGSRDRKVKISDWQKAVSRCF